MNITEPKTRGEWQEAVDAAEAALLIDSARQYQLVQGGPQINIARCEQLLKRGRRAGIRPDKTTVQRMLMRLVIDARGFTLVELLVSIAIVGVLVSILLPALASAQRTARAAACRAKLAGLSAMVVGYADDYRDLPASVDAFALPPSALKCPADAAAADYVYACPEYFFEWIRGETHARPMPSWRAVRVYEVNPHYPTFYEVFENHGSFQNVALWSGQIITNPLIERER